MRWVRNPQLAESAAQEVAARERYYPQMIEARTIDRSAAQADLLAWRTIAQLLDQGSVITDLRWRDLAAATSRAVASLERKLARKPSNPALHARLDLVQWIHDKFAWHHWFCGGMRGDRPGRPAAPLAEAA